MVPDKLTKCSAFTDLGYYHCDYWLKDDFSSQSPSDSVAAGIALLRVSSFTCEHRNELSFGTNAALEQPEDATSERLSAVRGAINLTNFTHFVEDALQHRKFVWVDCVAEFFDDYVYHVPNPKLFPACKRQRTSERPYDAHCTCGRPPVLGSNGKALAGNVFDSEHLGRPSARSLLKTQAITLFQQCLVELAPGKLLESLDVVACNLPPMPTATHRQHVQPVTGLCENPIFGKVAVDEYSDAFRCRTAAVEADHGGLPSLFFLDYDLSTRISSAAEAEHSSSDRRGATRRGQIPFNDVVFSKHSLRSIQDLDMKQCHPPYPLSPTASCHRVNFRGIATKAYPAGAEGVR